ncbi:hypothetical protein [Streptomyces sp. NPDC051677]|uniref:hypothetical protein n=1 Tax=Streptomyces sp. NPDC051677 TaxID=3365669 RepID=UPI0037D0E4B6
MLVSSCGPGRPRFVGGEDIDIVFEHSGRETFDVSVYVTHKRGTITCASTSGYRRSQ